MRNKTQMLEKIDQRYRSGLLSEQEHRAFIAGCAFSLGIDYMDLVNDYFRHCGMIEDPPIFSRLSRLTNPAPLGTLLEPKE